MQRKMMNNKITNPNFFESGNSQVQKTKGNFNPQLVMHNNNSSNFQNVISNQYTANNSTPNKINQNRGNSNPIHQQHQQQQNSIGSANKGIINKLKQARTTSTINLSNMNLEVFPAEIFDENLKFDDVNWWEMVDIKKIDCSNNKLTSEQFNTSDSVYNFSVLPSVNYLKFSFNFFTTIPNSIFSLFYLKFLDFSNNKLLKLSENIKILKNLVELNLQNNQLVFLPEEVGFLKELEILNLNNNQLSKLPTSFSNMTKLKRLDLSENKIEYIPDELNNMFMLEELLLFKNRIAKLGQNALLGLNNLKFLDLHNNFLLEFKNFPQSEKLDTVILGYNKIMEISNLSFCKKLTVLDINNNKIETFPEEILQLNELKTLNLQNNSVNDIPPMLCMLKNLVRINLEGNPLKKINSRIKSANAEQLKAYLKTRLTEEDIFKMSQIGGSLNSMEAKNELLELNTPQSQNKANEIVQKAMQLNTNNMIVNFIQNNTLQMTKQNLEEVPVEGIKKVKYNSLLSLDFSNNRIKKLDNFSTFYDDNGTIFQELKEIKFSQNQIQVFPEIFLTFNNLKAIELRGNNITEFLENFTVVSLNRNVINNFMCNLEYVDLSVNKLKYVPSIFQYLTNISVVLLSNNYLTDISIFSLNLFQKMDTLDFGNNKVEILPQKFYRNVPSLKILNLENNEVKIIPTELCLLHGLNKLNIVGNPIKTMRSNIINGGVNVLMDYLRKMHRFDNEDLEYDEKYNMNNKPIFSQKNNKNQAHNVQNTQQIENTSLNSREKTTGKKYELISQNSQNTGKSSSSASLDQVNQQILGVEAELANAGNLPMFQKTDLKKKLQGLIRERANLMK
jgi:Leucine-rich repeat (LRR) protein